MCSTTELNSSPHFTLARAHRVSRISRSPPPPPNFNLNHTTRPQTSAQQGLYHKLLIPKHLPQVPYQRIALPAPTQRRAAAPRGYDPIRPKSKMPPRKSTSSVTPADPDESIQASPQAQPSGETITATEQQLKARAEAGVSVEVRISTSGGQEAKIWIRPHDERDDESSLTCVCYRIISSPAP